MQHFFRINFYEKKINGRNIVPGKNVGPSLFVTKPASNIKRVDAWALDVAVPVTVKNYKNIRRAAVV